MKILPLFAVGLLVTFVTVGAKPSASHDQCAKHDEGKTYGLPSDCHKYVTCKNGKLEVKSCSSKKNYDVVTSKCVKIAKATCAAEAAPEEPEPVPEEPQPVEPEETDEQYDYLCNNVLYGIKVHPHACDKYISCMKQKAKIDICAEGHIFSEVRIECVAGNKATCTASDGETSPTDPESGSHEGSSGSESESSESGNESDSDEPSEELSDGYDHVCTNVVLGNKPHPESCEKYISCSKQKAKEKNCKDGYGYSSKYHLCVKEKNSDCAGSPEVPPATEEPPTTEPEVSEPSSEEIAEPEVPEEPETPSGEHDHICANTHHGKKPHPHSCKKYISCSKHKAKVVNCKKGYGYSSKSHLCVKEKNSDCAVSPQEPPATEEPPTTDPEVSEPSSEEVAEPEVPEDPESPSDGYDYVCAKTLLGNKPHPDSCNKYISCSKHKAKEVNCKKGYGYSSKLHLCVKQKNSDCPAEPEAPSNGYDYVCAKTLLGNKPHPDSCNKYISCSKHKAKEVNCKKGYGYSSKFHLCVKEKSSDCASSPEEPPVTEEPPTNGTTTKPEPETTQPWTTETTTAEPQPPTTKSQPATTKPQPETTQALTTEATTAEPQPQTTKSQPATTKPQPETTQPWTTEATTAEPKPQTTKSQPATTKPQPETTEPATTKSQPATTKPQPETTQALTTEATTAEPKPATTKSQPATTKPQPETTQALTTEATTAEPEPATTKSQPATTKPQPETTQALTTEATTAEPEPATTKSQPATTKPQPETTQALTTEATTAEPEPATTKSQPATTKPQPETTQALTTEATTAEPEPATTKSQPATTKPQPETTQALTTEATTAAPQEPSCEGIASGYLAIEGNCTQYVYCQQGKPELRDCLANYIFYEPFMACLPGNTATCELFGV
ncbi:proteoglycan 4-like [Anopheles cruzii]|uniref:proteoglycan 4-like n=1 Tax=Anopheles cruzii TaxID=68878 RepID=UPI0022EC360D|nr:proteoglycan 4-like [Anopheles cruzii]